MKLESKQNIIEKKENKEQYTVSKSKIEKYLSPCLHGIY
jgi:hypothetical protein